MSPSPKHLAALAALLLAAPIAAQRAQPDPADRAAIEAADTQIEAGHYLATIRALEPAVFDTAGKPRHNISWQYWQQFGAMLTERRLIASPTPPKPLAEAEAAPLRTADLADAMTEITRRARATSIVFLNEDHQDPRGRGFGLEVARALRPLGYTRLALETLGDDADDAVSAAKMAALTRDGYLRGHSGSYTRDPAFADFVRQAMALGYRPIAYEDTGAGATVAARDQGEADHLIARAKPTGVTDKLLVYVGHSHVTEAPIARGADTERWLATRVKAMTGIDPLTIDQTWLADGAPHLVLAPKLGQRSAVLMKDGRPYVWGAYAGAVDLQVVLPDLPDVAGRPGWLVGMGRRPSPVPPALLPTTGTRLVQAFLASEAADAVPIDQVLVTAGRPAPSLMLPPGARVRYATEDDTGITPLHAARQ